MAYRTDHGTHYHLRRGCHGAVTPCGTAGLEPCSDCCPGTGADGAGALGTRPGTAPLPPAATEAERIGRLDDIVGRMRGLVGEAEGIGERLAALQARQRELRAIEAEEIARRLEQEGAAPDETWEDGHRRITPRGLEDGSLASDLANDLTVVCPGPFGRHEVLDSYAVGYSVETHDTWIMGDVPRREATVTSHAIVEPPHDLLIRGASGFLLTIAMTCRDGDLSSSDGYRGHGSPAWGYGRTSVTMRLVPLTKGHYWEMRQLAYDYDYQLGNGIVTEPDTTDTPGGEWRWPDRVHDLGTREIATASCQRIGEVVADRAYDGCEVLVDSKDDGLRRWGQLGWRPDLSNSDWTRLTVCSYRVRDRQRARRST